MMLSVIYLLVLFQIKHFLADFPLQGTYMLGKFKAKGWVLPLACHTGVHALFTFLIVAVFTHSLKYSLILAALDFTVHFVVDRIKANPNGLGKFKPTDKYFWWALGADQMMHHLTHYAIIYFIIRIM